MGNDQYMMKEDENIENDEELNQRRKLQSEIATLKLEYYKYWNKIVEAWSNNSGRLLGWIADHATDGKQMKLQQWYSKRYEIKIQKRNDDDEINYLAKRIKMTSKWNYSNDIVKDMRWRFRKGMMMKK